MANVEDKLSRMRHLMNYGLKTESKQGKYNSVEYSNKALDGKIYGIIREGSKFYVKVMPNANKQVIAENFEYIGGFMNRKQYEYDSYANALKQYDLKMMSIKEACDSKGTIIESLDPNRKEILMVEATDKMKQEIARQRQIMLNAQLISEGKQIGANKCTACGCAKDKGFPYGSKQKTEQGKEVKGDAFNKDGEPMIQEEEVLAWNDNEDYLDKEHGTEIGDSAPFDKKVNASNEESKETVMEGKPKEVAPNEVNDWDEGLPEKEGVGEKGDSAPFDKKVNESIFEDEEIIDDEEPQLTADEDEIEVEDGEEELEDEGFEDDDMTLDDIFSLLQQLSDDVNEIKSQMSNEEYDDEPLYDEEEGDMEEDDEIGLDDEEEGEETYFEGKEYVNEEMLDDFGKHPAYQKEVMTLPQTDSETNDGYEDWNDESVESEEPFGTQIGDSSPYEEFSKKVENAITESLNRLGMLKKK